MTLTWNPLGNPIAGSHYAVGLRGTYTIMRIWTAHGPIWRLTGIGHDTLPLGAGIDSMHLDRAQKYAEHIDAEHIEAQASGT